MVQKSALAKVSNTVNKFDKLINEKYIDNLEYYYIPVIQDIIMRDYDAELVGRVTDRRSKTNPIFYKDEFQQGLLDFEWIKEEKDKIILVTPETDTFDWRQGRLRIIENIVEGTIGRFMEVNGEQYLSMYNKNPIIQPFDGSVPIKERIYTLRITIDTTRRWRNSFPRDAIIEYPFSNQPPINLFDSANTYVNENINKWIEEAIKDATKEIKK
jgi:hypothetical protein